MQWLPVFTGVLQNIHRREGADRADSKALAAELVRVEGLDKNNKAVSELIREVDNAARYGTPDYLEFVTTGDEGDKNRTKNGYVSIHTYKDAIETLEVFSGRVEAAYKDQNTAEAKAAADMVNALKEKHFSKHKLYLQHWKQDGDKRGRKLEELKAEAERIDPLLDGLKPGTAKAQYEIDSESLRQQLEAERKRLADIQAEKENAKPVDLDEQIRKAQKKSAQQSRRLATGHIPTRTSCPSSMR